MSIKDGCNDKKCSVSTGLFGEVTFGRGKLDFNGYWEIDCLECARAWKKQYPEDSTVPMIK